MQDTLIKFETAKLAKEKGFDFTTKYVVCCTKQDFKGKNIFGILTSNKSDINYLEAKSLKLIENLSNRHLPIVLNDLENDLFEMYSAPTQSLLQKWLRDQHQIFITIGTDQTCEPEFYFEINRFYGDPKDLSAKEWYWEPIIPAEPVLYRSYEEALESALWLSLQNI